MELDRRGFLRGVSLGASLSLVGCVGLIESLDSHPGDYECDPGLYPYSQFFDLVTYNSSDGFQLSIDNDTIPKGEPVSIWMENITDQNRSTTSAQHYTVQKRIDGEWVDLYYTSSRDTARPAKTHSPGEGFSWTFRATAEGPGNRRTLCYDITPAEYRFVYYGVDGPAIAVRFTITD